MNTVTPSTTSDEIVFSNVKESSLLTLYCRVQENRRAEPNLEDPRALEIGSRTDHLLAASQSGSQKLISGANLPDAVLVHICGCWVRERSCS